MVVRARVPKQNDQDIVYYDTRYSIPVFVFFLLALFGIVTCIFLNGMRIAYVACIFFDFIFFVLFCCVRIEADQNSISGSYGIGVFKYEIGIGEVKSFAIDKSRYFVAWLYNPLATYALKLNFRDGGFKTIPADDPKRLATFLRLKA